MTCVKQEQFGSPGLSRYCHSLILMTVIELANDSQFGVAGPPFGQKVKKK